MDLVLLYFPPIISVLVLILLNRLFKLKESLINFFGIFKYKLILLISMLILGYILTFKYNISVLRNPISLSLLASYMYLVNIYRKPR